MRAVTTVQIALVGLLFVAAEVLRRERRQHTDVWASVTDHL
ncbi:hypothetical protein [Propioniciclava tarda]|nr:hypothetical protein [Propioniciclava tarda]SMO32818.1 hypothetical protein SAMN06266982_10187 [Propioniciclava tarda]HOA89074.1 hypothetical protein [Propioniciclava tarda]HQA31199.1 hypothetical protein [Propioniciclava tarda]HQD61085.1 hypothetical protein [Propioniciclava tarda]